VLARAARDISVGDIVYCVDQLDAQSAAEREAALNAPGGQVWEQLRSQAMDYLDTVSLQQLIDAARSRRSVSDSESIAQVG
jgi:DNA-binding IscR family transcriptional regulator